jgi:hypothetical protein
VISPHQLDDDDDDTSILEKCWFLPISPHGIAIQGELKLWREFWMKKSEKVDTPVAACKIVSVFPNIECLLKIFSVMPVTIQHQNDLLLHQTELIIIIIFHHKFRPGWPVLVSAVISCSSLLSGRPGRRLPFG